MIEFVTAKETLDFLVRSAPRPWVKRMLLRMVLNQELTAFFRKGRSVSKTLAAMIVIHAAEGNYRADQKDALITRLFEQEMAHRLISAGDMGYIEDVVFEWAEVDAPRIVSPGPLVYASNIDWEGGSLEATIYWDQDRIRGVFEGDEELFDSELPHSEHFVTMSGFCFQRESIEMLQPHVELGLSVAGPRAEPAARIGRPRTWDWEGSTAHLLSIAQTPDGLPMGQGAQAQIERLIADWFMTSAGNAPAESQVRQHAAKIMIALNRPKSR